MISKEAMTKLLKEKCDQAAQWLDMVENMPLKGPAIHFSHIFRVGVGKRFVPKVMDLLVIPHSYNHESIKAKVLASPLEWPLFFQGRPYKTDKDELTSVSLRCITRWRICPCEDYIRYVGLPYISPEFSRILKGDADVLLSQPTHTGTTGSQ